MKKNALRFGRLYAGAERDFGSLGIEFLVDGGRGAPVTAMRVAMKPNDRHAPLRHARTAEFFLVLRGSMRATIARRLRRFRAGDYAYLPPGTVHAFQAGRSGVEVLSLFVPALDMKKPDIIFENAAP
jgi:quercetin dioxygenase-like cupin family protein